MDVLSRKRNWTLGGTTATIAPILINRYLGDLDLSIMTDCGNIPDCYKGYHNIRKKYYKTDITTAFSKIISLREDSGFICVMYHSGRTNDSHIRAGLDWINCCKDNDVCDSLIAFMTDNQNGYNIYNSKMEIVKYFSKKDVGEPWMAVEWMQDRYGYTAIFGDISMSESNTYQKCNDEYNVVVTDLVVKPLGRMPIRNMTSIIQKVGRIYTNDTINTDLDRVIWFYKDSKCNINDRMFFERGMKIEACIQKRSENSNMLDLNYNDINREVKRGLIDLDGNVIEITSDEPENVKEGVIEILRESGKPMTSREIYGEMVRKGWFSKYSVLYEQVCNILTHKRSRHIFQRNNNKYKLA